MERLNNNRMEEFCQIMASEGCDPNEACLRAGYGGSSHIVVDSYIRAQASRLMANQDVQLRIATLQDKVIEKDSGFREDMIRTLKNIMFADYGKYFKTAEVKLPNGQVVDDLRFRVPLQSWDEEFRKLTINGFNRRGLPVFIDKQWAMDRLLKIYRLDGTDRNIVEDRNSLYANAGLPQASFSNDPAIDELLRQEAELDDSESNG